VRWIEKGATMREALELSAKSGHSRLPVVDGDFDHVMGFVHVKDLLRYTDAELAAEPVTDVLRGVLFAQHDSASDHVLVRMQREHKLMAIIQSQNGHNIGICTAEDLLEELVGEITDEFDPESQVRVERQEYSSS
jgi:CBS domain containing-hemolysin-like protein